MDKLAIMGGTPVRKEKIYYGHQFIDEDDVDAVSKVLRSDYITCGPAVLKAERDLEVYTGAKHAVLVSNGTAALHTACLAAGISEGDEVITTPLTFAASANCILYCGGRPVFADVDIETYNISPQSIIEKISSKTKAVIAVDYTGQSVECDTIRKICDDYDLIFIEDAAHSIGTSYKGKMIGSIADYTCFSFHPVKNITCGEGGAILTNNDESYKRLQLARSHGITKSIEDFKGYSEGDWYYEQQFLGYNYRLTDIQAALLSSQLKKLDSFKKRRKEICSIYDEELSKYEELILQKNVSDSDSCKHLYTIRLNEEKLSCSRKEFFDAMCAENIQCQVHYIPVYWFPYYEELGYSRGLCPNAEKIYQSIISIPLFPKMNNEDVYDVIKAIDKIVNYYRR
jgi:UDP-4-amino-4,6-dideoxy-N-acetyl-beta-L-altrosamine transaminase